MPNRYEQFEAALSEALKKRTGAGSSFGATLIPALLDLLITTLTGCLSGNDPASVAKRAAAPSQLERRLMSIAVMKHLYQRSARAYRLDKGDELVDSVFDACAVLGPENMTMLIVESKPTIAEWAM